MKIEWKNNLKNMKSRLLNKLSNKNIKKTVLYIDSIKINSIKNNCKISQKKYINR